MSSQPSFSPKVRMAQPSSSHQERHHRSDRERERDRERSHHHTRTISSTTLLLVLSLVLAVLAVMLSLPSGSIASSSAETNSSGVLGYLTPKRTQALIARESAVAIREAEVARREAELLAGAPGGVIPTPSPILCPPCAASTTIETITAPVQTIIKEVVKEDSLTPPGWVGPRAEEILDRELKIAERERDISKREESVNRREHDASRRESWIMEQLHDLGNDNPQHVEEEYVYEPVGSKRKSKYHELPPLVVSETAYETETKTVIQTQTVTVPPPANTRLAANPKPEGATSTSTAASPRTTAVEVITEEDDDEEPERQTRTVKRGPRSTRRPPSRWFGGCLLTPPPHTRPHFTDGWMDSRFDGMMLRTTYVALLRYLCLLVVRVIEFLLNLAACYERRESSLLAYSLPKHLEILGDHYPTDAITNVTPAILEKVPLRLHAQPSHPLSTLRGLIESHYPDFAHLSSLSPLVTPFKNFDELSFPKDHPGRAVTDSYYVNKDMMLRTHTSAHEVEVFRRGETKWLLTADVYRRDEIDGSHYPVFHQMEGARIFNADASGMEEVEENNARLSQQLARSNIVIEDIPHISPTNPVQPSHDPRYSELVALNLKLSLNTLMLKLFGGVAGASRQDPLRVRWIEAYFPFTSPSFEVEVFFQGKWLEILGCGVAGFDCEVDVPDKIGWAFGLGLERIAMILYSIPDIRLFWSLDSRFISQFEDGKITTFRPYSKYPSCFKDVSFWSPQERSLHENDFCDLVRDVAGDLVEDVQKIDDFVHPKTSRRSMCFRINYRSMDRSLSNGEVNEIQSQVVSRLTDQLGVEIR
ncbi:Phenylalanine--tRNA ligase, mitochondrial [Hypsizygus marmoreus]|uniref:Phenylalanine--tRNA ligase, mitochondrial n=1 Tax=Hypsizygus marmoreus TaxID=39966 RepID=A0A369JJ70_HYPMA|nr:Phenylalanine--tRNA ligase, mitochondrial [Hypsizygus marmoreus]